MVDIRNLCINYGDTAALTDVSLRVREGTVCSIIGPSGCGKTSLLMATAGLLTPDRGEIHIGGKDVTAPPENTGIVFQNPGLFPWKTVLDNVALGLYRVRGNKKRSSIRELRDRAEQYLVQLGIADQKNKFPGSLSGGQLQRAAICRAIIGEPKLLLMDEGGAALDEITREKLQDLIVGLQAARSLTVIAVTHSIAEAVYLGDMIVVMAGGRIRNVITNSIHSRSRTSGEFYRMNTRVRQLLDNAAESGGVPQYSGDSS